MMSSGGWFVRLARVLLGALAIVAVGRQFLVEVWLPGFSPVNFFSYFTILSNIAAGLLLVRLGVAPGLGNRVWLEWLRGGMTVYMATTGIVFALLLDDGDLGLTLPWVNTVMHRVVPVVMFLDWLVVRPRARVGYGRALSWLFVPLAYVTYALVRGAVTGWFPYPFLRPEAVGGIDGVLLHLLFMALGIAAAAVLVAWLGNVRVGERSEERVPV
ncbi:Pr6Pr family membrane protein [Actinopolyspora mortivallis]|uniref:Pr6Pr family membrane protein n=1 Tax=Actinopolyspora mortivallis TaxID=33906 RepID=UPI00037A8E18|nr:Pr6Pr family membrane protein [Actinopolyspora mortivallis]